MITFKDILDVIEKHAVVVKDFEADEMCTNPHVAGWPAFIYKIEVRDIKQYLPDLRGKWKHADYSGGIFPEDLCLYCDHLEELKDLIRKQTVFYLAIRIADEQGLSASIPFPPRTLEVQHTEREKNMLQEFRSQPSGNYRTVNIEEI